MKPYASLTKDEQLAELKALQEKYAEIKAKGLSLNMARGKPSSAQLDIISDMLTVLSKSEDCYDGKLDVRNYGELLGIPSARALFADILDTVPEKVIVGGSASLQLMFDLISKAYTHGLLHSPAPWAKLDKVKFLCPAPGYDRHFTVSSTFGMELIYVPMTEFGPDMDVVENAVKDPDVKGIWCVPKYSNPDGIIYSDETIDRLVHLKPAAPDFTIMWDNAYCIHEVIGDYVPFPDILSLAAAAGTEDMFYEFASTSKVTYPGAGISCMASSVANVEHIKKILTGQRGAHQEDPHRPDHQLRQGEPAPPREVSEEQGQHPGAHEEACRRAGAQVHRRAGRSRQGDRSPGDRHLASSQGRLLRQLLCHARHR